MKYAKLFLFCITIVFTACSYPCPDMVNILNVKNLNYSCGSYINWDELENATEYNVYTISSGDVRKVLTTRKTSTLIDSASIDIAVSAIINGKETYLSSPKKGENTWWTSVKCTKLDSGYSLSWNKLPIAEDYVLISRYSVEYVMIEYTSAANEFKTSNLEEYQHKSANPGNPYNACYYYRKCKSLNTTNNNIIFTDTCFNSGMYSNYVCLYAKIGESYYRISDNFRLK
ncbi:hypothetical protein [Treponema sp.]|uniref:hypothetical protein n=1 Tax=Treponema sp. TaxID=166 RepID=UPI003FA33384